ncbi:MAG TPA: glycosyltransferase [Solirubrobacteraceae bacterium]|nr:glycosyltransferase [Solirubrobacteraceae bacterium]
MALRLTGTSLSTPDSAGVAGDQSAPPESGSAFAANLAAQARLHLGANQRERYHALFERAAEHKDPQAVYHARVRLIEEGLEAAGRAPSTAQAAQLFVAVAKAAIDVLEEEPREPVLLNYAGVALYELWSLDAAHDIFKAAQRLDPALSHLKRNLSELGRRRRERSRGDGPRGPLHAAVPGLAARARSIATKARPATGLTLSLCMIVRDEEDMLPRCLAAAAPAVNEIVIVDTGSTDRTIEIAHEFGAKVIEREWTGSFSEPRNVSFEAATGDWIIYLDADEVLVAEDVQRLKALTGRVWREAFYLVETSYTGELGEGGAVTNSALRVFRNRPHYRFEGRLHEQIAQHLPTYAAGRIEQSVVRVEHYGYLGAVRDAKEKSRRNVELLRAQQADSPPSAFLHFNLGTEYSVIGDHASALSEYELAWSMIESRGEESHDYVPTLVHGIVDALRFCGRPEEAIARAQDGLKRFPGFTDLVFTQALASISLGREEEAIGLWQRCIEMGDAPSRYGAAVGGGSYLPRIALAELYMRRGGLESARELLEWCVAKHPSFPGVVAPYATVLLQSGVDGDAVAAEIEARITDLSPGARFMLASVLYARGAMAAAERQFRAVRSARPQSSQVRARLAEALLNQARYGEAAEEAAGVPEDDAFAGLACRIELWGRIAAGDLDGAQGATARAARAGVSAAELDVFAGWLELASGIQEPRSLRVASTPLLGVILETLLRLHDFEAFEKLLGLLERSSLPPREQRELLASMYLAHGFLASAAKEWMAICESRPDARALLGLARVAAAHGELANAAVFAAEALRHDPASAPARELLARCSNEPQPEPAVISN